MQNNFIAPKIIQQNMLLAMLLTTLCFVVNYLVFGFYSVDYEGFYHAFYSGNMTPGMPFRSIYFLANIGISHIYSYLYEWAPKVEWLSWIYYTYLYSTNFLGLFLIAFFLPSATGTWLKSAIMVFVFFVVFADHNIHLIYTRVAYLICGLSTIGLVTLFPNLNKIRQHKILFGSLNLFLTIGILTRVESAAAIIALVVVWGMWYLQDVKQFLRIFLYPILLTAIILISIAIQIKTGTDFYLQVEPDIELQFCERKNIQPLAVMKTHRDSVLYITATNIMWSDPKILSAAYLRSLVKPEAFIYSDMGQWKRAFSDMRVIFGRYKSSLFLWLTLAITLYVVSPFKTKKYRLLYFLAFEGSFWIMNAMQTYTAKINDRSFAPYISIFIFLHLILLLGSLKKNESKRGHLLLILFVIFFGVRITELFYEAQLLKLDLIRYQSNFEKIKKIAANRILVINSSSSDYLFLSYVPFQPFDFSFFKKVYLTDGYIIPFLPYYKSYLEKECNCNIYEFPSFWNYLKSIPTDIIVISSPQRIQIIKAYLKEIYQVDLSLTEDVHTPLLSERKSDDRDNMEEMKVYVFKK